MSTVNHAPQKAPVGALEVGSERIRVTTTEARQITHQTSTRPPMTGLSPPPDRSAGLPATRDLTLAYVLSLVVALLIAAVSAVGLAFGPAGLYAADPKLAAGVTPSTAGILVPGFLAHDLFNLVVGLPILLGVVWLARRGALIGRLLWPGALFYVVYTYSLYVVGAPFNVLFLPYIILVTLSAYTLIGIVASINGEAVGERLVAVPARIVGGALIGLTALAVAGLTSVVIGALTGPTPGEPALSPQGIAVDYVVGSAPLLIGGVLRWRRQDLGYVTAAGLLLVSVAGGVAFAVSVVLEGLLTGSPIDADAAAVHLVIAAVYLGLLAFFLRGAASGKRAVSGSGRPSAAPSAIVR
jgi:hypothetical protein